MSKLYDIINELDNLVESQDIVDEKSFGKWRVTVQPSSYDDDRLTCTFYDLSQDPKKFPGGQQTPGTYYVDSLFSSKWGPSIEDMNDLRLYVGEPSWTVEHEDLVNIAKWLKQYTSDNRINENSVEEYWDATEIAREGFSALLRFNFGSDANGDNYIIVKDNTEIKRFRANSDEEAISYFNKWKNAKRDGFGSYTMDEDDELNEDNEGSSWLSKEENEWLANNGYDVKLDELLSYYQSTGDVDTDAKNLNDKAVDFFYDQAHKYNEKIDSLCTKWAHDKAIELNSLDESENLKDELLSTYNLDVALKIGDEYANDMDLPMDKFAKETRNNYVKDIYYACATNVTSYGEMSYKFLNSTIDGYLASFYANEIKVDTTAPSEWREKVYDRITTDFKDIFPQRHDEK